MIYFIHCLIILVTTSSSILCFNDEHSLDIMLGVSYYLEIVTFNDIHIFGYTTDFMPLIHICHLWWTVDDMNC